MPARNLMDGQLKHPEVRALRRVASCFTNQRSAMNKTQHPLNFVVQGPLSRSRVGAGMLAVILLLELVSSIGVGAAKSPAPLGTATGSAALWPHQLTSSCRSEALSVMSSCVPVTARLR